jgi:GH15 family glucan-1,4-alpha-glucosidase
VLCWVALDRLIALHDRFGLDIPIWRFHAERNALRAEIETRGYSERIGSYTSTLDGDEVDASLLTLALYGYIEPAHIRMRSTFERIIADLGAGPLVYRNAGPDGDFAEGAFGICGFWAVEVQARAGDIAGAIERFEALLGYANDVGLFAEEIDPETGTALGNTPQLFTHIGLINAALTLQELQDPDRAARLRNRAAAEARSGPRSRVRGILPS